MLKMLLLRLLHIRKMPYALALKRRIYAEESEYWSDCAIEVTLLVELAGVTPPNDADTEGEYIIAAEAIGLKRKPRPEPEGKEEGELLQALRG